MQLKELGKDGSQSVLRRAFARKIFGERSILFGRHLVQKYDSSGQIRHSGKIEKFKRRCDCSQNQSWRVADHVTRTEKLRRFLSWLQWIKYWSRCWIWTPDSKTSDRIWCWFDNIWSNLMLIPECVITESTEFTTRELRSSESSSKNTCRHYDSSR